MAWHRVQLTAAEQDVVKAERESHPQSHVRRKMLVLSAFLNCGLTRAKAATVAGLGRATVRRLSRRLSGRRPGRTAAVGCDRPGQRPGVLYGRHSGFAHRRPGSDGSRGVRPHRAVDRPTGGRQDPRSVRF